MYETVKIGENGKQCPDCGYWNPDGEQSRHCLYCMHSLDGIKSQVKIDKSEKKDIITRKKCPICKRLNPGYVAQCLSCGTFLHKVEPKQYDNN